MLWKEDGKSAVDGHMRLSENLQTTEVMRLDHARFLTFPLGHPPELLDLKRDSPPVLLPEIGPSSNVFRWFGTKKIWPYDGPLSILCQWNGTNQIVVRELRGAEFIPRGVITVDSGTRPSGFSYNATRQLLAWTELSSSTSIHLASIAEPGRRIELRSDIPNLVPFRFSENGKYLAAQTAGTSLRVWDIESGKIVVSINESTSDATFAAGGQVLVAAVNQHADHVVEFHDLAHPDQPPSIPGKRQFADPAGVSVQSDAEVPSRGIPDADGGVFKSRARSQNPAVRRNSQRRQALVPLRFGLPSFFTGREIDALDAVAVVQIVRTR